MAIKLRQTATSTMENQLYKKSKEKIPKQNYTAQSVVKFMYYIRAMTSKMCTFILVNRTNKCVMSVNYISQIDKPLILTTCIWKLLYHIIFIIPKKCDCVQNHFSIVTKNLSYNSLLTFSKECQQFHGCVLDYLKTKAWMRDVIYTKHIYWLFFYVLREYELC